MLNKARKEDIMKKMIFTAALVLASTAAMAQKSNFQVKGELKNFSSDTILVYKGRGVKMDTILVKKDNLFCNRIYFQKWRDFYQIYQGWCVFCGQRRLFAYIGWRLCAEP